MSDVEITYPSCPNPSVINPLVSTGFVIQFSRFKNLTLFAKAVTIPPVSLNSANQATRHVAIKHPGTIPEVSSLQFEYTIDANLDNFVTLYDWITLIGVAESGGDISSFIKKYPSFLPENKKDVDFPDLVSDAYVTVFGESQKPVRLLTFRSCYPTNVEGFQVREDTTETTYLTGNATFDFFGKYLISDLMS